MVVYAQQFDFMVGNQPIDLTDIVRPLTLEYDPDTRIIDYKLDDPDFIQPQILDDTPPYRFVINTNWNPRERLGVSLILVSRKPTRKPIDVRFKNGVLKSRLSSLTVAET